MNTIGQRIRARRKELGFTQKEVALEVGVSAVAVTQWEGDDTSPRGDNLFKLAEVLRCKPDYLLGNQDQATVNSALGDRIKLARERNGMSLAELRDACGWHKLGRRLSNYENGIAEPTYREIADLSRVLHVSAAWLAFGGKDDFSTGVSEARAKDSHPQGGLAVSEVELPYFEGLHDLALLENAGGFTKGLSTKPFSKSELEAVSVKQEDAAITRVSSNSMDPTIPVGSLIGIDRSSTDVKDGEMYLAHYYDLLIIMRLHRVPGGLRATYVNEKDWPVDIISAEKAKHLRVIGRVFWYSVLR